MTGNWGSVSCNACQRSIECLINKLMSAWTAFEFAIVHGKIPFKV